MKSVARDRPAARSPLKFADSDLVQSHNSPAKRSNLKASPLKLSPELPAKQQLDSDIGEELFLLFRDMQEKLVSLLSSTGSTTKQMDAILNSKESELRSFVDRNCRDFIFLLRNMFHLVLQTNDKEQTVQKTLKDLKTLDPADSFHIIAELERKIVDLKNVSEC